MNPYRVALDEMHQRGWGKTNLESPDGRVCAVGALGCALGTDPWYGYDDRVMQGEEAQELKRLILAEYPNIVDQDIDTVCDPGVAVFTFNDHPKIELSDVERMFEKAAVAYDERI